MKAVDVSMRRVHILVCTHQRPATDGMPSCSSGGEEVFARLHGWVRERGASAVVWVNRAGCLGWCHAAGCTVAVYPDGALYHRVTVDECDTILAEHVLPALRR